jgi:hypothetical protein
MSVIEANVIALPKGLPCTQRPPPPPSAKALLHKHAHVLARPTHTHTHNHTPGAQGATSASKPEVSCGGVVSVRKDGEALGSILFGVETG